MRLGCLTSETRLSHNRDAMRQLHPQPPSSHQQTHHNIIIIIEKNGEKAKNATQTPQFHAQSHAAELFGYVLFKYALRGIVAFFTKSLQRVRARCAPVLQFIRWVD